MDNDFLDGIDEHFERLMKLNGNGRRNGRSRNGASRDRTVLEIMDRLGELSSMQKEEVLDYVRRLSKNPDQLDISQSLESDSGE